MTVILFIVIAILLLILSRVLHRQTDEMNSGSLKQVPNKNADLENHKTYWESYKKSNPQRSLELEKLYGDSFSQLCDEDIKQRIKSTERAMTAQKCQISELKDNFIKLLDRMIPEIGENEGRLVLQQAQQKELIEGDVKLENSFTSLCIKWFNQYVANRQNDMPVEQQFREQIRFTLNKELGRMGDNDNPYINGMQSFIYINSMYKGMRNSDSVKAMNVILAPKGQSAYDILDEEINAALKKYCGMDISCLQDDEFEDDLF